MDIGSRLKLFAKQIGSAKDLADKLGMKPPALQSYLNNRSKPGADIIIKLHNLGCDIVWLLTGERDIKYEIASAPPGAINGEQIDYQSLSGEIERLLKENSQLHKQILKLEGKIELLKEQLADSHECKYRPVVEVDAGARKPNSQAKGPVVKV
jgi:transcriptional regulator with XRE-family HTH domain